MKPGTIVNVKGKYSVYVVTHETMGGTKVYVREANDKRFPGFYDLVEISKCSRI